MLEYRITDFITYDMNQRSQTKQSKRILDCIEILKKYEELKN